MCFPLRLKVAGAEDKETDKFCPVMDREDEIPNEPVKLNKTILSRK